MSASIAAEAAAVVAEAAAAAGVRTDTPVDIAAPAAPVVGADYARYFAVVREDPADFSSWTLLLQACAAEKSFDAIAEAYDAFLAAYPFCYAYWKKYADHTQRHAAANALGPAPVVAVYERGVRAVPQSVDMWGHYCNFMSSLTMEKTTVEAVRDVHRRAVATVGSAPLSNTSKTCQLWNALLRFEMEVARDPKHVGEAYHLLLRTPFRGFGAFLVRYEEWAKSPAAALDAAEGDSAVSDAALAQLRADVVATGTALPDGFDELPRPARVLHCVKTLHQLAQKEQAVRDPYETPLGYYFHVKPLTSVELQAWKTYLAFEQDCEAQAEAAVAAGSGSAQALAAARARTETLFERALVRCACYPEFWLACADYKAARADLTADDVVAVYRRCCDVHLKLQPGPRLACAEFLEAQCRAKEARQEYAGLASVYPALVQGALARANFERRQGDDAAAQAVLEAALAASLPAASAASAAMDEATPVAAAGSDQAAADAGSGAAAAAGAGGGGEAAAAPAAAAPPTRVGTDASAFLAVHLAQFHLHVRGNARAARAVFEAQRGAHEGSADFVAAYLAFELAHFGPAGAAALLARLLAAGSRVPPALQASLWRRRVELAEDFGRGLTLAALVALRKQRDAAVAALESGVVGAGAGAASASGDASSAALAGAPAKRGPTENGGVAKKSRIEGGAGAAPAAAAAAVAAGAGAGAAAAQHVPQQQPQQQQDPALAAQWAAYYAQQAAYGQQQAGPTGYGHPQQAGPAGYGHPQQAGPAGYGHPQQQQGPGYGYGGY